MAELLKTLYTTSSGPGYSASQTVPSYSLGGYASTSIWSGGALNDLFNLASSTDVADVRADYRAVYIYNPDPTETAYNVKFYVTPQTSGASYFYIGVDPRPVTLIDSLAPQGVSTTSTYNSPDGVEFSQPLTDEDAILIGDIPPYGGRVVWFKRIPSGGEGAAWDYVDISFISDNFTEIVRRVYWETEPYADKTRPDPCPVFIPTSTPIKNVFVYFLTTGGARITWTIDNQLIDAGPYRYQLQASQSGSDNSEDWINVGPQYEDAFYILDPTQRLWGMSSTLHYRVILTTAVTSYISPSAHIFGKFTVKEWLFVQEIIRKERLMLAGLGTGVDGFLLKAKRYGQRCSCVNSYTGEVGDSSCTICYGQGIVGGYHTPIPCTLINVGGPQSIEAVAYNENLGTVRPVKLTGRVIATVPFVHKDAWVAIGSDERFYVHEVNELVSWNSVPIVLQPTLRMAPRSDILYTVPLTRPEQPIPEWKTITNIPI